jgi:hypothetical protein
MNDYVIVTTKHEAWPRGVMLFWGPERSGYTSILDDAGRYTREEAASICGDSTECFMVAFADLDKEAVRVVPKYRRGR